MKRWPGAAQATITGRPGGKFGGKIGRSLNLPPQAGWPAFLLPAPASSPNGQSVSKTDPNYSPSSSSASDTVVLFRKQRLQYRLLKSQPLSRQQNNPSLWISRIFCKHPSSPWSQAEGSLCRTVYTGAMADLSCYSRLVNLAVGVVMVLGGT